MSISEHKTIASPVLMTPAAKHRNHIEWLVSVCQFESSMRIEEEAGSIQGK